MSALNLETPTSVDPAEVAALLDAAGKVPYVYRALREFSATFDPCSELTAAAIREAIAKRQADEFTILFIACGMAGQLPGAWVLAEGTPLFTEVPIMVACALHLEGDLRGAILEAVGSGRLNLEREASLLLILAFWREREGIAEPDEEVLKVQRRAALNVTRHSGRSVPVSLMEMVGSLSRDTEILRLMGYAMIDRPEVLAPGIDLYREHVNSAIDWRSLVPNKLVADSLSAGATITRIAPRIQRNDPCPCGSGKKYKKCCSGKESSGSAYAIEGQAVDDVKANPELLLTSRVVGELRAYEVFRFDPQKLAPGVLEAVVGRLVLFHENARAREMLDAVDPARLDRQIWEQLELDFIEAEDLESLRWLVEKCGAEREPYFQAEVLLASPDRAIELLLGKVRSAQQQHAEGDPMARVSFTEIAQAAAAIDPALGLILARGAIPFVESVHFDLIGEIINRCRIELGLSGDDPGIAWMVADDEGNEREWEHQRELEKLEAKAEERVAKRKREASLLKTRLRSLQSELEKREKPTRSSATDASKPDPLSAAERAALDELHDQSRMLKANLKQEHQDHARDRDALRQAQQELRWLKAKQSQTGGKDDRDAADDEEKQLGESVEPMHGARLPDYADAFRRSLAKFDNRIAANAITLAGKLAASDAHAWRGVRKLRGRPDTLRQKLGRDHRLLFKADSDRIEFTDLINRRDLDDWIRRGGG